MKALRHHFNKWSSGQSKRSVKIAYYAYCVLIAIVAALTSPWLYDSPITMWVFCALTVCLVVPMFLAVLYKTP